MRRVYATGEAAVREALNQQLTKFEYPDELGGGGGISIGGGGGAPTFVIAASNSLDEEKAKADFVCAGVNDQDIIQSALDLLSVGGRLLFCSGTFSISFNGSANCITSGGFSGFTFEGMGAEATIFNVTDSYSGSGLDSYAFEMTDSDIGFYKFTLQGGDGVSAATNGIAMGNNNRVHDVNFAVDGIGVFASTGSSVVASSQFYTGETGVHFTGDLNSVIACEFSTSGDGIFTSGSYTRISDNYILASTTAIEEGGGAYTMIQNNYIESLNNEGIAIGSGTSNMIVQGNNIIAATYGIDGTAAATATVVAQNIFTFGASSAGIRGNGLGWLIEGNFFSGSNWGIINQGDQEWVIRGNRLTGTDGIQINAAGHNTTIDGNYIDSGGQILFDGGSFNECKVSNNIWTTAGTPSVDGAIVFDNGATLCQITNNSIPDANGLDGIRVESASDVMISGNLIGGCDKGIVVNGDGVSIVGNQFNFPGEHGIHASDLSDSVIADNLIWKPGQNTTNTWDGIILDGDSDRNHIMNNRIIGSSSAPKPRYALNVSAATCDDNSYLGNRSGPSGDYGTGTYNDAGTGTINTWPAAAAPQGDNLQ